MNIKKAKTTKIAVFGSAFNPPSLGHKSVIESLNHFDKVLLIPSIAHAWGKEMLEYEIRCVLVDRFIEDMKLPFVEKSMVEKYLYKPEESVTTFAVLEQLQKEYPDSELTFVIGPDNFFKFSKFYKAEAITRRWSVIACPEKVKIRSTDIRKNIQSRKSIDSLTTSGVATYLKSHRLYL